MNLNKYQTDKIEIKMFILLKKKIYFSWSVSDDDDDDDFQSFVSSTIYKNIIF